MKGEPVGGGEGPVEVEGRVAVDDMTMAGAGLGRAHVDAAEGA